VAERIIELPPGEQRAYLDRVYPAGHPARRAVEALLGADVEASERVWPPRQLRGFQLMERLGTGAFGEVWHARDTRVSGRHVALKFFYARGEAEAQFRSVQREADLAARVRSRHVVRVEGVEQTEDEPPVTYLITELCYARSPGGEVVVGRSLAEAGVIARGEPAFSPAEAARLIAQAARGIAAAHNLGVLHRDVKPGNILIRPPEKPGDAPEAVVIDFGIGKDVSAELPSRRGSFAPGELAGALAGAHPGAGLAGGGATSTALALTPAYAAPEQAATGAGTMASDVYALGATLYTLFTGASPYSGTEAQVLEKLAAGPPQPLARRPPRASPPGARLRARDGARSGPPLRLGRPAGR
jgi:serine/threonine-protein kinase